MKVFLGLIAFLFFQSSISLGKANKGVLLRSLSVGATQVFSKKSKSPQVFVVFQPNCSACHAQVADLTCLKSKASVNLIGAFATEKKLRKEYKVLNAPYPGYLGDEDFQSEFEVTERLSPQVILAHNGRVEVILGYKPCKKILKKILGAQK